VIRYEQNVLAGGYKRVRDSDGDPPENCENASVVKNKQRRSGGVLVGIFPCGKVAAIAGIPDNETLQMVMCFVADLKHRYSSITNVIYDYSCGLKKYICNRQQEKHSGEVAVWYDKLSKLNYILDEFHSKTHKCVLEDPNSTFKLSNHLNLVVNSQLCEQRFKQWNRTCKHTTSMSTSCSLLFYKIVAHTENELLAGGLTAEQLEGGGFGGRRGPRRRTRRVEKNARARSNEVLGELLVSGKEVVKTDGKP
jgi:hypothetical protein